MRAAAGYEVLPGLGYEHREAGTSWKLLAVIVAASL